MLCTVGTETYKKKQTQKQNKVFSTLFLQVVSTTQLFVSIGISIVAVYQN